MSNHPTFSYDQVLDSINEMRRNLRSVDNPNAEISWHAEAWDADCPFWEEARQPHEGWFDDCEFDPRSHEDN